MAIHTLSIISTGDIGYRCHTEAHVAYLGKRAVVILITDWINAEAGVQIFIIDTNHSFPEKRMFAFIYTGVSRLSNVM